MTLIMEIVTNDHDEMSVFITMEYDISSAIVKSGGDREHEAHLLSE